MKPAVTTLVLDVVFLGLAIGWRSVAQARRTGHHGFVAFRERGTAARVSGLLMVASLVLLATGVAVALGDDRGWEPAAAVGALAMITGLGLCLAAQQAMGASWRIGVDPDETTSLVTGGLFARLRNPIFTAMVLFAAGHALAVPNVWNALGALALAAGIGGQVLLVEEPHLRRVHGASYARYAAASGRFLPRVRA